MAKDFTTQNFTTDQQKAAMYKGPDILQAKTKKRTGVTTFQTKLGPNHVSIWFSELNRLPKRTFQKSLLWLVNTFKLHF